MISLIVSISMVVSSAVVNVHAIEQGMDDSLESVSFDGSRASQNFSFSNVDTHGSNVGTISVPNARSITIYFSTALDHDATVLICRQDNDDIQGSFVIPVIGPPYTISTIRYLNGAGTYYFWVISGGTEGSTTSGSFSVTY